MGTTIRRENKSSQTTAPSPTQPPPDGLAAARGTHPHITQELSQKVSPGCNSFTDNPSCSQPRGHECWELLGEHWTEAELNVVGKPDDLWDLVAFLAGPDWSSKVFKLVLHLKAHGHVALLFLRGNLDENSYLVGFSEGNNAAKQKTKELGQLSSPSIVLRDLFWHKVRGMLSLQPTAWTCLTRTIALVGSCCSFPKGLTAPPASRSECTTLL